jgi:uncharacterized protein
MYKLMTTPSPITTPATATATTWPGLVLVDGPNADMTLAEIVGRKPRPQERPCWNHVYHYSRQQLQCGCAEFVLNGNRFGDKVAPLFRALRFIGWRVAYPRDSSQDPVDAYIQCRLVSVRGTRRHVVLLSHDGGYAPYLLDLIVTGSPVTIIGFREELSPALLILESRGATILDLEHDLGAFRIRLPRPYQPSRN